MIRSQSARISGSRFPTPCFTALKAVATRGHGGCSKIVLVWLNVLLVLRVFFPLSSGIRRRPSSIIRRLLFPLSLVHSLCFRFAGIWTGAIYNDRSLRLGLGFLGEGVQNNSVILVKSHHFYGPKFMAPLFNLTIHLIRSPFSSLPAERKRVVSVHNEHVNSPSWSEFVLGQTMPGDPWRLTSKVHWSNWTSLAAQRLLKTIKFVDEIEEVHNMPVHTMRFEDLKHRLLPTMKDALKFIGQSSL